MKQLRCFVDEILFQRSELTQCRDRIAIVLAGSRAAGYDTSTSDYDLLGLCDAATYPLLLRDMGQDPSVAGIDISVDRKEAEQVLGREVDLAVYERLAGAMHLYKKLGFHQTEPYYDNPLTGVVCWELELNKTGIDGRYATESDRTGKSHAPWTERVAPRRAE